MDLDWRRYYKMNQFLLLLIGLWPSRFRKLNKLHMIFSYIVILTAISLQLTALFKPVNDVQTLLRLLSTVVPCIVMLLKFTTYHIKYPEIKIIMEKVQDDWNAVKDQKNGIAIMKKYANDGRLFTLWLTIIFCSGTMALFSIQLAPQFLDILLPLNESRPPLTLNVSSNYLDSHKHLFSVLLIDNICAVVGLTTILSTEALFMVYVQHACGMFQVAGHQLENAVDESVLQIPDTERTVVIYGRIITAVNIHRRAIEFADFLWSTFAISYFVLITIGVISISISLFQLFELLETLSEIKEISIFVIFVFAHFSYLFLGNFFGQRLMDHSDDVFQKTYNARWYETSVPIQKLFLFILQRTMKANTFLSASIFVVSLKGFTTLANMSFSYFMLLHSAG